MSCRFRAASIEKSVPCQLQGTALVFSYPEEYRGKRLFLQFDGAAHIATFTLIWNIIIYFRVFFF